eukprot:TRINITY_DN24504_c0_g1_i6.p1 TRINITY_DN24504_c0_g1~~TRINITY_DN24504_c0_g1_i6.p1  ORF type:complete len:106 (+),score=27.75 TRINITY_DN24504_c0_g1_i6:85-402(+)
MRRCYFFFFFFKQKTAYEMLRSLVGSEMCIRDRYHAGCVCSSQHPGCTDHRQKWFLCCQGRCQGLPPSCASGGLMAHEGSNHHVHHHVVLDHVQILPRWKGTPGD